MNKIRDLSPDFLKADRFFLITACFLMFLKRLVLHSYGINYEAGKDFEGILRILEGKLIYKDFYWHYGPISLYVSALTCKLLNTVNLLIPRWIVTLIGVATTYYSYKSARFFLSSPWAFWVTLMASSGLVVRENNLIILL